jgi:hypothetical protein
MVVVRARLGKPRTTFGAQPGAVFLAPRRERQRENQSISKDRLEIEQVPVQRVPVLTGIPAVLLITEQFLAPDLDRLGDGFQAPGALPGHRRGGGGGGEHTLGDGLQPDLEVQFGALRNPGHAGVEIRGGGHGPGFGTRRPGAAVERPGIEDQQPTGVSAGAGCPAE